MIFSYILLSPHTILFVIRNLLFFFFLFYNACHGKSLNALCHFVSNGSWWAGKKKVKEAVSRLFHLPSFVLSYRYFTHCYKLFVGFFTVFFSCEVGCKVALSIQDVLQKYMDLSTEVHSLYLVQIWPVSILDWPLRLQAPHLHRMHRSLV